MAFIPYVVCRLLHSEGFISVHKCTHHRVFTQRAKAVAEIAAAGYPIPKKKLSLKELIACTFDNAHFISPINYNVHIWSLTYQLARPQFQKYIVFFYFPLMFDILRWSFCLDWVYHIVLIIAFVTLAFSIFMVFNQGEVLVLLDWFVRKSEQRQQGRYSQKGFQIVSFEKRIHSINNFKVS